MGGGGRGGGSRHNFFKSAIYFTEGGPMVYLKKNYNFPRFQGGPTFSRRWGSNCSFLWTPIAFVIFQEGRGSGPLLWIVAQFLSQNIHC